MARTVLGFSLRCTDASATEALAAEVGAALDVPLQPAWHEGKDAFVGSALGMTVALYPWGGPGGTTLHVLQGAVTDPAYVLPPEDPSVPAVRLDISDAVADLLEVRGAGSWHRPTPDELEAHTAWSRAHED